MASQRISLFKACFFGLVISSLSNLLMAGSTTINADFDKQILDAQLEYLRDSDEVYDITQLANPKTTLDWQKNSEGIRSYVIETGLYWFKTRLTNDQDTPVTLMLEIPHPTINVADLYTVSPSGEINLVYADIGLNGAFDNRPTHHRNIVNAIVLPPKGELTLIWRIDSYPTFDFNVIAWRLNAFFKNDQQVQMLHGMIYGSLIVMWLYNLFLYISTRQKSYLYYVLYLATATYMIAADEGHIYQYINTDTAWSKFNLYAFVYALNLIMFAKFSVHFLSLKKHTRLLQWGINGTAIAGATSILALAAFYHQPLLHMTLIFSSLLYILTLIAGVKVRMLGIMSAGHFIIAIMVLAFALITANMASLGLINSTALIDNLPAIGTTVMMVFFSLALADRINQLNRENQDLSLSMSHANEDKEKASRELMTLQREQIKLEQSAYQAQLESKAKSDFLATMSHEIRTPMNGVLGMSELLKATELNSKQARYVNTIEQSGKSLLAIISDLQDYSKIEAGTMELALDSFNLENLIDDCVSTFALRANEKQLNFIVDLNQDIPPVLRGDKTKLQQIILNLLSNAFKFTDHGDIVLTVTTTDKAAVNSLELRFSIRDSGIGLTKQEQSRLFTPFQQADKSTYGRYGGSGLGLAISKQLAELMDGHIGLESTPGKGSCFWFTARLMIDENPSPQLLKEKSAHLRGKHLLLLDGSALNMDIMSRLLTSWGLLVDCASTLEEAQAATKELSNAATHYYDFILADYQLQDGNGVELIKQLALQTVNILMISGHETIRQTDLDSAHIEILVDKPITTSALHDALITALNPASTEVVQAGQPANNHDFSQLKVLLVDDNEVNQMVINGLLNKQSIQATTANNGLEAIELLEQSDFDLILMDCEMPVMDGYEATKQIRKKEKLQNKKAVTIIALSAHAKNDHQQKASAVGMDGYLTKPVTYAELSKKITELVK